MALNVRSPTSVLQHVDLIPDEALDQAQSVHEFKPTVSDNSFTRQFLKESQSSELRNHLTAALESVDLTRKQNHMMRFGQEPTRRCVQEPQFKAVQGQYTQAPHPGPSGFQHQ